jgi:hypothetical protein
MQGFITGKHVVRHGAAIIGSFGLGCWLRCVASLFSSQPTTFLSIACTGSHGLHADHEGKDGAPARSAR